MMSIFFKTFSFNHNLYSLSYCLCKTTTSSLLINKHYFCHQNVSIERLNGKRFMFNRHVGENSTSYKVDDINRKFFSPNAANFYWQNRAIYPPSTQMHSNALNIKYNDKITVSDALFQLIEKNRLPHENTILINEGCDNGYILGKVLGFFKTRATNLRLLLTDVNPNALVCSANYAMHFMDSKHIGVCQQDSIKDYPNIAYFFKDYEKTSKIFLLYRLSMICELKDLKKMISDRKNLDGLIVCNFLAAEESSLDNLVKKEQFNISQLSKEVYTLNKYPTSRILDFLRGTGCRDLSFSLTAFTKGGIYDFAEKIGVEVLHISLADARTDLNTNIKVWCVIFG